MTIEECHTCRKSFDTEQGYELHIIGHKLDNFSQIMERFIGWFEKASKAQVEETERLR